MANSAAFTTKIQFYNGGHAYGKNKVLSFMEAEGVIEYNMTNNYMFRFILQKNKKVLKGLICSLLHLTPEQIKSIEITNPINLAGDVTGKEFILDFHIVLNNE